MQETAQLVSEAQPTHPPPSGTHVLATLPVITGSSSNGTCSSARAATAEIQALAMRDTGCFSSESSLSPFRVCISRKQVQELEKSTNPMWDASIAMRFLVARENFRPRMSLLFSWSWLRQAHGRSRMKERSDPRNGDEYGVSLTSSAVLVSGRAEAQGHNCLMLSAHQHISTSLITLWAFYP